MHLGREFSRCGGELEQLLGVAEFRVELHKLVLQILVILVENIFSTDSTTLAVVLFC